MNTLDDLVAATVATLTGRPSRVADFALENQAIVLLAGAMADNPSRVLQRLADLVMLLCRSGSAGVSILENHPTAGDIFRWQAVAGAWAPHAGATIPREASLGNVVVERDADLLVCAPMPLLLAVGPFEPPMSEILLAPFHAGKRPIGTVWAIAHDPSRHFDAEDRRLLESMARFASAAWQTIVTAEALARLNATLEQQIVARTADRNHLWALSTDIMTVVDFDGLIVDVNPAWTTILGWPKAELIGYPLTDLVHPDDLAATLERGKILSQGAAVRRLENRFRHKDGSHRWISWSAAPGNGLIIGAGRDFTAEKEQSEALATTEEQLRQSQKMEAVGQLTGGIAHDFNNMLTGITGSLDMIRRRLDAKRSDGIDRFMNTAMSSAQRAAALTHRLLAFARRQSLDSKPADLNALVAGMADMLQRTLGKKVAIETVAQSDLWPALTDANQLESALLNLAINARDAMPDGGRLTIATQNRHIDEAASLWNGGIAVGDYVSIAVTDTGSGMRPEIVAKAFEPFFTTKPVGEGTGLGLSMIYGFAKQSGGHANIDSEIGKGTTVKLYLPRARDRRAAVDGVDAIDAVDAVVVGAPRGGSETVLVVEDDTTVRFIMVAVLDDLGYRHMEAPDAQSALPFLEGDGRIDLLLSDVGLPHMNGRQLAEIARQHRPLLKVLFVTGYAETVAVPDGILPPGMAMMAKPFAPAALAAKIRALIED